MKKIIIYLDGSTCPEECCPGVLKLEGNKYSCLNCDISVMNRQDNRRKVRESSERNFRYSVKEISRRLYPQD